MDETQAKPECFGDLETVFPMGPDGLRHSPERCMHHCPHNTACLRAALRSEKGEIVEEERIDRAVESGLMGFFERWSRKKNIHQRRVQQQKRRGT